MCVAENLSIRCLKYIEWFTTESFKAARALGTRSEDYKLIVFARSEDI